MDTVEKLTQQGWYVSSEGLKTVNENDNLKDLKLIIRKLLDADLREISSPILATEITKNKISQVVVQVQKVRNISAPKINEESHVAPRMLKLTITDGTFSCQAIETEQIPSLSLERTLPGTKLLLKDCDVVSGCVLLKPNTCSVLGGKVTAMLEKWEITKSLPKHNRGSGRGGVDGPPAWVNFGKKIESAAVVGLGQPFKSLQTKEKEKKENEEFEVLRQDAIAEAATGAVKKVFGGGVKQQSLSYQQQQQQQQQPEQTYGKYNSNSNNGRPPKGARNRREGPRRDDRSETDKNQKPSDKISLFAFLEDKLPVNPEKPLETFDSRQSGYGYNVNGYGSGGGYDRSDSTYRSYNRNGSGSNSGSGRFEHSAPRKPYGNGDYKLPTFNNTRSTTERPNYPPQEDSIAFVAGVRPSERAPRFQRNNDSHSYFSDNAKFDFPKPKFYGHGSSSSTADANDFVADSVTNVFDKMSLNDGGNFARNTLKQQLNFPRDPARSRVNIVKPQQRQQNEFPQQRQQQMQREASSEDFESGYVWNIGDRCMAKYWEDYKYYNAIVTAITNRTCVVQFIEYGNFEEVLKSDCIPITEDVQEQPEKPNKRSSQYQNNQYSENPEFRHNKNRSYVKHNFQQH